MLDLAKFKVYPDRGFLPKPDPLEKLPDYFSPWEEICRNMPKLLAAKRLRSAVKSMPLLDAGRLNNEPELECAKRDIFFMVNAFVWENWENSPEKIIPAQLAIPGHHISLRLGLPPTLSYSSYAMHNWRRIDPSGPIALSNISLIRNFLGGLDEEWFILPHVEIEAEAGPALTAAVKALDAAAKNYLEELMTHLSVMAASENAMHNTLLRIPEHCDPYIYYNRVRPYIHGWKNNPALPDGVIYEGVKAYRGQPKKFGGETGAQSSIVPSLDAVLGVQHDKDELYHYLMEMRDYMPPAHRAFLRKLESRPSVREYVLANKEHPALKSAYNECVRWLWMFRAQHLKYAGLYINSQAKKSAANPTAYGTGGTPFIPYLQKHLDDTEACLIK